MNLPAIALYALGIPVAGLAASASFDGDQKARRRALGLPPRPLGPSETFATVVAALIWPILGAVCCLAVVWPAKRRPNLGRTPKA